MNYEDLITLGIAFGLGLLVGLQREKSDHEMAGVRTFTLIAILGTVAGFLTRDLKNPFILPVFGIAVTTFMLMANYMKSKKEPDMDVGQTTEVAVLLMFAIGSYLVLGDQIIGVIVGGILAILLYVKESLHNFIDRLKEKDLSAIMTFAGISLVILPILPNETFGPLDVLNPRNIWLMITLIVGISIVGYFIYKFLGKKTGLISNGILGGMISSTATTVSYSKKTTDSKSIHKLAAFIITVASAVSFIRILVEIGIVAPTKIPEVILPILAELVLMILLCAFLFYYIKKDKEENEMPEPKNPAQFKTALLFGLLYGGVLLAVAFTKQEFGEDALYIVAIVSGLTDVNAITLSLSRLMQSGGLESSSGWRLILLAALSNLFFKGIVAAVLGTKLLAKWIGIVFGIAITAGLLIMWLWPESWHF